VINSVLKAVDILKVFSSSEPRLSLAEIGSRLGLPKSTTHNLLKTLLSQSFIEKTDDGRYALGTAIIALTQSVRVNLELRDIAAPLLRSLAGGCISTLSSHLTAYGLALRSVTAPTFIVHRWVKPSSVV
jgi:DNA-binding IclR family transcriptional regulator